MTPQHTETEATMPESFAPALAEALRAAITRNPLLSLEDWTKYTALLARYDAA